ncbi:MAG: hypothetical protein GX445_08180 [Elusimicrobia bacterium]|nr:hypothetical protein [Elusimicrobiota bacterium]
MNADINDAISDFLKSFTKVMVYASLYAVDHPQVKSSSADVIRKIKALLSILSTDKIFLTISDNKFLINGASLFTVDKLPNSLLHIYRDCHIDTIIISSDVSENEIIKFSKISASKKDPETFLSENSIKNIKLSKDVYVKANVKKSISVDTADITSIESDIENQNFIESLKSIVSKLTTNSDLQQRIIDNLIKKFKREVESAIETAIKEVKIEKNRIKNDYTRTESIIANIAGSEIMVDKNGNIIMASANAHNITGKELKDIAGKKIFDIVNQDDKIINIAEETKTVSDENINSKVITKGKEDIVNSLKNSTAIIKNEEGKIIGTVSAPSDIVKMNEVEQLKNDFISSVTHELRSPLTSIKMALDLISKEDISNPSTKLMLNSAIRNAERLNSIINEILDFSKLQSGKMIFNLSDESANDIAQSAVDSMKAWAESKKIALTLVKMQGYDRIYADKRKTEQILINLLSNAMKFTPENGMVEVAVSPSGEFVEFSVKDSGCGIRKEDQEKIFEKFVQSVNGEKAGGTGLGLAITKAMVVMQGGRISVESEVGKGSVFKVLIPIYKDHISDVEVKLKEEVKKSDGEKNWWKKIFKI